MKSMLVPVDFSDVTAALVRTAGDWALAAGYGVHLFHVMPEETDLVGYETGMQLYPHIPVSQPMQDNPVMQACKNELTGRGIEVTTRITQGSPVLDILDEALAIHAEVIVMGSHRHGMLHHLLLGSVSGGVLRRATCPVLIVPTPLLEPVTSGEWSVASGQQG